MKGGLFPEWQEQHQAEQVDPKVVQMRRTFGHGPEGAVCRDCVYLDAHRHGRRSYFKCALYGNSLSAATDWRAKWPACGKYVKKERSQ